MLNVSFRRVYDFSEITPCYSEAKSTLLILVLYQKDNFTITVKKDEISQYV